jgi:hypothetical protein
MNETLINQESNRSTSAAKLFGLPRPIAGAIIGIFLFMLIYFACYAADLEIISTALNAPGIFAYFIFGSLIDNLSISASTSDFLTEVIFIGISSIPFAIFGSMFVSKNRVIVFIGFSLLIIYFAISTFIAFGIYAFAMDL